MQDTGAGHSKPCQCSTVAEVVLGFKRRVTDDYSQDQNADATTDRGTGWSVEISPPRVAFTPVRLAVPACAATQPITWAYRKILQSSPLSLVWRAWTPTGFLRDGLTAPWWLDDGWAGVIANNCRPAIAVTLGYDVHCDGVSVGVVAEKLYVQPPPGAVCTCCGRALPADCHSWPVPARIADNSRIESSCIAPLCSLKCEYEVKAACREYATWLTEERKRIDRARSLTWRLRRILRSTLPSSTADC